MDETPISTTAALNLSPDVVHAAERLTPEAARAQLQAIRSNPDHDFHHSWRPNHVPACEQVWALEMRAHAQPARVPVSLPEGPSVKDLKEQYKAMMADAEGWRDGTITPDDAQNLDQAIRLREAQEAAARPGPLPRPPSITETFSEKDLDGVLPKHWMQPERDRYKSAVQAMGLTPWQGAEFNAVLQTAQMTGAVDLTLGGETTLDFDTLWGAQAASNIKTINTYLSRLKRHSPEDHDAILPFVNQSADVANAVLEFARRGR